MLFRSFGTRIGRWLAQLSAGDAPDAIEGSGVEGLLAHAVVESAIRSHETGQVVVVAELLDEAARIAGLDGWSR